MTTETMRDLYRLEHLDQATRIFGVAEIPSLIPSRRCFITPAFVAKT